MSKRQALLVFFCVALLVLGIHAAANAKTTVLLDSITADQIADILDELGIAYEREIDSDGDPMFTFKLGGTTGYNVRLFSIGDGTTLQLYAGFSGVPEDLEKVNWWNKNKRFSRAYYNNGYCLESDLNLESGVTRATVIEFIQLYEASVTEFVRHLTS